MLTMESQGFSLVRFSENGTPYAEVGLLGDTSLTVEGATYRLAGDGTLTTTMFDDDRPIITAEWTGPNSFDANWQGSRFVARRPSRWRSTVELHLNGEPVGTMRVKFLQTTADLADSVPLPIRTFLLYASLILGPGRGPYAKASPHS